MHALAALALAVAAAAGGRLPNASGPSDAGARGDVDLRACPECVGHQWEVLQGVEDPDAAAKGRELADSVTESDSTHTVDNGVDRDYGDGYSEIIRFGGYSHTQLCTRIERSQPINGHSNCPLKSDWYHMWPAKAEAFTHAGGIECWVDSMQVYQKGKTLNNAPGQTTIMGRCPKAGEPAPPAGYRGDSYDWRFGSIRPQDNPDMQLYPEIAAHIEDIVNKTGKKVVVRGCSGGTINGYAFLMSQTVAWRQKHVMAFVAVAPVFGGTIASLSSILLGWDKGVNPGGGEAARCIGRMVATLLPSVLWMWPHPGTGYGEWNQTEVLIQTPKRNYTAYDLDRFLTDMGLPKTQHMYDLEKTDLLGAFPPPMVDTYVFYGYGISTIAGFKLDRNISAEEDGPEVCPPAKGVGILSRPWDDGDVTAPRRSCARAEAWAEPHAKAGVVLKNFGYKGNHHGCDCKVQECTTMYNCVLNKLAGKPHSGC